MELTDCDNQDPLMTVIVIILLLFRGLPTKTFGMIRCIISIKAKFTLLLYNFHINFHILSRKCRQMYVILDDKIVSTFITIKKIGINLIVLTLSRVDF